MMVAKEPNFFRPRLLEPTLPEGEPGEDQPNNVYGGNGLIRPRLFGDAGAAPCAHGAALESGLSPQTAYQTWSIQSQGSRGYRFHMPVPAGWIWVPPSAPDVLAVFVPIDVFGPQITVRAQRVRWEVDVLAWLMHRCHAGGLAVTMARQQAGYEDARFELGGTRDFDGAIWRISAALHKGRLLIVETLVPASLWDVMHELVGRCRRDFEVLPVPQWTAIEPQRTYKTEQIQFAAPSSWIAQEHTLARGHERYLLSAAASQCCGVVRIDTGCSATPLDVRQSRILCDFEDRGWSPLGRFSTYPSGIRTFTGIFEGRTEYRGEPYHLRVSHRRLGMAYVDYTTVAPEDDRFTEDAMRTMRAAEIAIESTVAHTNLDGETAILRRPHEGSAR